jgi:hypothetical protein
MLRYGKTLFIQVIYGLVIKVHLPVAGKMFKVGPDHRLALPDNGLHHGFLVVCTSFPLDN